MKLSFQTQKLNSIWFLMWIILEWNALVHFVIAHSFGIGKLGSWEDIYKTKCTKNIVMESYLMYSIRREKTSTCRISRRRIEALAISTIWTNYQRLATKRIFPQPIFKNLNGDDNLINPCKVMSSPILNPI